TPARTLNLDVTRSSWVRRRTSVYPCPRDLTHQVLRDGRLAAGGRDLQNQCRGPPHAAAVPLLNERGGDAEERIDRAELVDVGAARDEPARRGFEIRLADRGMPGAGRVDRRVEPGQAVRQIALEPVETAENRPLRAAARQRHGPRGAAREP